MHRHFRPAIDREAARCEFRHRPRWFSASPTGAAGFFITRYDAGGSRDWVSIALENEANAGGAAGVGVSLDAAGNSYVIGNLVGTVTFGVAEPSQTTLIGHSLFVLDFFVAKYNPDGAFVWARSVGGDGSDEVRAIAADAAGNVHVTGTFDATVTFGAGEPSEESLTANFGDMFLVKYDSGGAQQWVSHAPGLGFGGGAAIAVDAGGGIHVAGGFVASVTFGPGEANETVLSVDPGGSTNVFVAKYDDGGDLLWARAATGTFAAVARGVAADAAGNSYVTGDFAFLAPIGGLSSLTFGHGEANETTLTTEGAGELFVARYTNDNGEPTNRRPIADAGGDQTVDVGAIVALDGSASSDPDLDPLTYEWVLVSKPPASGAALQNPTAVNPAFVADVAGAYQVTLVVNDRHTSSAPDVVVDHDGEQAADRQRRRRSVGHHHFHDSAERGRFERSRRRRAHLRVVVRDDAAAKRRRAEQSNQRLPFVHRGCARRVRRAADCQRRAARKRRRHRDHHGQPAGLVRSRVRLAGIGHDYGARRSRFVYVHRAGRADHFTRARQHRRLRLLAEQPQCGVESGCTVRCGRGRNPGIEQPEPVHAADGWRLYDSRQRQQPDDDRVLQHQPTVSVPGSKSGCHLLAVRRIRGRRDRRPGRNRFVHAHRSGGADHLTRDRQHKWLRRLTKQPQCRVDAVCALRRRCRHAGVEQPGLLTLPMNGVYAIRVSANNLATTGSYNISRECLSPVQSPDAVPMPCGGFATGTIGAPGETDLYTLTGQAGQIISLAIASTDGFATSPSSRSAVLTLFAPSGAVVGTLASNSQALLTLPMNGVYAIRVSANNLATTGSYNISRECLSPVQSPDVVPIACGALAAGTIAAPGETDLFAFTGSAGQIISLALTSTGGFTTRPSSRSVVLTMFASAGTAVGGTLASNSQSPYTLPADGVYTLRVSANNLATTGSYTVRRTCP